MKSGHRSVRVLPRRAITWGKIKAKIEKAGVVDSDQVFMIDIGPGDIEIFVERDKEGWLEISDDPAIIVDSANPKRYHFATERRPHVPDQGH